MIKLHRLPGGGGTDTAVGSTVDIRGIIRTSQTWRKDFIFRLRGYVYVTMELLYD
jgi:hypothetical protein